MNVSTDIRQLQDCLEKLYNSLGHNGVYSNNSIKNDLKILLNVLQCPVFESILNVQSSLQQLKEHLKQTPSILPDDFDIDPSTQELRISPSHNNNNNNVGSKENSGSDLENTFDYDSRTMPSKFSLQKYINDSSEAVHQEPDYVNIPLQDYEFRKGISQLAQGRFVQTVELCKPEGMSLGFKVVGLEKDNDGKLGIYIQEIHDNGIAARNGLLKPNDQILAINSHLFTSDLSQENAIQILQSAKGIIQLVVARGETVLETVGGDVTASNNNKAKPQDDLIVKRTSSNLSATSSKDSASETMVLNSEWAQIECIEFENDGEGLGFGIVGGKSSGVVVKNLVPGGVADRDNRLQIGDHILQINAVSIRGMGSEQVAQILRQSSAQIKLIVARAVDPTSDLQVILNTSTIIPTKSLSDMAEMQRVINDLEQSIHELNLNQIQTNLARCDANAKIYVNSYEANGHNMEAMPQTQDVTDSASSDMQTFEVELIKDQQGLGITIAGYVCEKAEEISGIFIKSIAPNSVADRSQKIQVNDQIIEVDGQSLYGYNNLQAVELLRSTSNRVRLKLARYTKGNKYDKINEGVISATNEVTTSPINMSRQTNGATVIQIGSYNPPPPPALRPPAEVVQFWSKIVGPQYDIIIANVSKFCHDGGLGISLEGTIDIENGQEGRPRHYITSISPEGPVGRNKILRQNDELLEVNGIRLHGLRHSDVLPLLKDLPIEVQLICARPKVMVTSQESIMPPSAKAYEDDQNAPNTISQDAKQFAERMIKAKSDGSLAILPPLATSISPTNNISTELRSRSLEPLAGLAMWSSEPQFIELVKGDRGLGFSILDYQDPMNLNESVIVIRSLVPGGVAQQDGRLLPGDRLLYVNDHNLENATLEHAVQTLKGAPKGVVVVGVAKPLPLPESSKKLSNVSGASNPMQSYEDKLDTLRNGNEQNVQVVIDETDKMANHGQESKQEGNSADAVQIVDNNKSSHVDCDEPDEQEDGDDVDALQQSNCIDMQQHQMLRQAVADATLRKQSLLEETHSLDTSTATTTTISDNQRKSSTDISLSSPSLSSGSSSSLTSVSNKFNDENVFLPMDAEVTIKITRNKFDSLGMSLKPLNGNGIHGCVVKSLEATGVIPRDGRVHAGDIVVSLNQKSLRNVSKNELLTIVNRCDSSDEPHLIVGYIPQSGEANRFVHSQTMIDPEKWTEVHDHSPTKLSETGNEEQGDRIEHQMTHGEHWLEGHHHHQAKPCALNINEHHLANNEVPKQVSSALSPPSSSTTTTPSSSSSNSVLPNASFRHHWGQEITVQLVRDEQKGFGISIIGGKNNQLGLASLTGILIKKILPDSSAARSDSLKTGDRLLEVGGIDLRNATHDEAVEAIKNAKSPVRFVVQSLVLVNKDLRSSSGNLMTSSESSLNKSQSVSDNSLVNIDASQDKISSTHAPASSTPLDPKVQTIAKSSSFVFECASDVNSAAHVKLTTQEMNESLAQELNEDEYGYSHKKIKKKYSDINGATLLVDLQKGLTGLGISLAGNRDRTKMSVFICGMHPKGSAFKDGRLQIGDEILEVNGIVLYGRSHLNASAIIKGLACPSYRIIVLRRDQALDEMAVKPLTQFPVHLEDFLEEKYCKFKGVRTITVRKGSQGLGIMIIEGKHSQLGRGVFVSDIQDGSSAESAGLSVGDMILCVNQTDLIGADYDTAANALKCAEGLLTLVIAKPGKMIHHESHNNVSTSISKQSLSAEEHHHHHHQHEQQQQLHNLDSLSSSSHDNLHSLREPKAHQDRMSQQPSDQSHHSDLNLKTCPLRVGEETTIEIVRDKIGLGLSIVGGANTPQNAIIIHEVYKNGAADIDGRLKPGDQILEVNGEDLRNALHEHAIKVLRQTASIIKMKVIRRPDSEEYDTFDIKLTKKPGKGLGLSIVAKKDGHGIFVSDIIKGGVAELDGHLAVGDQILKLNNHNLDNIAQEQAAFLLKTAKGTIDLTIGRFKSGCSIAASSKPDELNADEIKEIELERAVDGFGFSIVGGHGSAQGDLPICIRKICADSPAACDGRLREGDIILAINDISISGITHDQVVDILRNVTHKVKLYVLNTSA